MDGQSLLHQAILVRDGFQAQTKERLAAGPVKPEQVCRWKERLEILNSEIERIEKEVKR